MLRELLILIICIVWPLVGEGRDSLPLCGRDSRGHGKLSGVPWPLKPRCQRVSFPPLFRVSESQETLSGS